MQTIIAVIQLFLIAVAFGLCGFLFISLKKEMQFAEKRAKADADSSAARIDALERQIAELRKEMETTLPQPVPGPSNGITLNKRSQALKLVRMGEGPEHIAAALSLPRREVELLMKVQRMIVDANNTATS